MCHRDWFRNGNLPNQYLASPGFINGFINKHMANFGPIRMKPRTFTLVVEFLFLPSLLFLSFLTPLSDEACGPVGSILQSWSESDLGWSCYLGKQSKEKESNWVFMTPLNDWIKQTLMPALPLDFQSLYVFCFRCSERNGGCGSVHSSKMLETT